MSSGEMILYRTDDGQTQIELRAADGTVWLTQAEIATLFDTSVPNISMHIKTILEDGERDQATIQQHLIVRWEGARQDLFAQTSVDYDRTEQIAREFFATIQNKLVFAVTGRTAAELIVERADPRTPNMGLTSWTGARVRKGDVTVSKNYLAGGEIDELNRLTTMFLDFAEDRARRRQQTRMADWVVQTDRFLDFNERRVLGHAGSVSRDEMTKVAQERFEAFDAERRALEAAEADREAAEELTAIEAEARLRREAGAGGEDRPP